MPVLETKKNSSTKKPTSVSELIVRRSKQKSKSAPLLTEDVVPAGQYHSVVIAIDDAKSDAGKQMVDVTYRLTDARGKAVDARVRYPAVGYHIERLFDALIDAGLPEGSPLTDAISIAEELEIAYPYEGALGKIKARHPAVVKKAPPRSVVDDDDEEEDDVLTDEDDEDDDYDFLEEEG